VVDAGTGLRALGQKLATEQGQATSWNYNVVLSHVHWDHIQGLPFFEPAYIQGTTINIYAMRVAADELRQVVGGITRHEFFPVPLDSVPADFEFHEVDAGTSFELDDFEILPIALNHPYGAVGYKIESDTTSLAYLSDTAPFTDMLHKQHFLAGPEEPSDADRDELAKLRADVIESIRGVDTVIYDTHFLPDEYEKFPHYGHSTPEHALDIVTGIGVRRLILYHHAPNHTDAIMDEVAETYAKLGAERNIEVIVAREGMVLSVGQVTDPGVGP
jgi:phosphoribosyl 1,2-cyclic phosphodiesterase